MLAVPVVLEMMLLHGGRLLLHWKCSWRLCEPLRQMQDRRRVARRLSPAEGRCSARQNCLELQNQPVDERPAVCILAGLVVFAVGVIEAGSDTNPGTNDVTRAEFHAKLFVIAARVEFAPAISRRHRIGFEAFSVDQ